MDDADLLVCCYGGLSTPLAGHDCIEVLGTWPAHVGREHVSAIGRAAARADRVGKEIGVAVCAYEPSAVLGLNPRCCAKAHRVDGLDLILDVRCDLG